MLLRNYSENRNKKFQIQEGVTPLPESFTGANVPPPPPCIRPCVLWLRSKLLNRDSCLSGCKKGMKKLAVVARKLNPSSVLFTIILTPASSLNLLSSLTWVHILSLFFFNPIGPTLIFLTQFVQPF